MFAAIASTLHFFCNVISLESGDISSSALQIYEDSVTWQNLFR
jgi:hypothetical protein